MPRKLLFRPRWVLWGLTLFLSFLLLTGCAAKPYLTKDNSYTIVFNSAAGTSQVYPLKLTWNSNMAVMQKLLLESSFVLADLSTSTPTAKAEDSTVLRADFPESKQMFLMIDDQEVKMDVKSLEIEVDGPSLGLVTINDTLIVQGIPNTNLSSALNDLLDMLAKAQPDKE